MNLVDYNVVFTSNTPQEIVDVYNRIVQNSGSIEDLKAELSEYEKYSPLFIKFLLSKFQLSKSLLREASTLITEVINELDSVEDLSIGLNQHILASIYGHAGEIYANNNQLLESQTAYQDYQLCLCRLKGLELKESLLSFRKYNEYSLSDLINNEITVCSPRVMNDPYDTLLLKWGDYLKERKDKPHIQPFCNSLESYRIRSFSHLTSKDGKEMLSNILMWSHYADNHCGFCIQYKFSDDFLKVTEERRTVRLHEITYQSNDEPLNLHLDEGSINTQIGLCTKQNQWEYENEVRLIAYEPDVEGYFHSIPIDEGSHIENVYFGYRCPRKHIETIKRILSNQCQVKYYQMHSKPEDIYHLYCVEI